ncbi:NAD(P)H-dependent glycerol-3-phosphate dehydrogenase [Tichowtungia aerotolerans]|uniref:Glycerol-3-phosphate dehydrogenase [NAD(P)+] n=1 Tax=Tichowtungia aerotolerans TaxID=2697043 RepID=A0A6P1MAG0_9BACT|nr:NAD(P)H-dependent glycerol-3-phosphate dehydrogenase [Tichowtungia aerotolerans]QHI68556.1 NAD(P)H-dependent glycerol-3-phosphate dehydrogenase [Tichowtungia aerotolerans]
MNCFVIGNGGWGTALAMTLAGNGHRVTIWGPFEEEIETIRSAGENSVYLPGVDLPSEIKWTSDPSASAGTDLVVMVTPSRFYRSTLETFVPYLSENTLIVSATKGLDEKTHQRMSEVAEEVLHREIAVLSGPSHAEEVARGVPTAVTVAGSDFQTLEKIQAAFMGPAFRVYTSDDLIGVELGGTLKNVIAVAAGILDGIGLGDNSKAALMTRGLAEIARLGAALGAKPETFSGLSGIGDLIVTCASRHSRNRSVGERLGRGESLQEIMNGMKQVAEGIWNAKAARDLAEKHHIDVPITEEVCQIVENGKDPKQALHDLMNRDPKAE